MTPSNPFLALAARAGYHDLCIGNYWITESRLTIPRINFLAPTAQEQFKLLHPPYDLEDSDLTIFTWMKPFSKGLWWCILGSVLVTGIMYHILCAEEKFVYDPTIETAKQYEEKVRMGEWMRTDAAVRTLTDK